MGQLDGKIAVVTGGGRGIGRAIAKRYAEEGADVVISSRTQSDLDAVVEYMESRGRTGVAVVADATVKESAQEPVRVALERFGRVDVLVNNVGGTIGRHHDPFADDPDGSFERTLLFCLTSIYWTTQAAFPSMREQGSGRVISIGSGASKHASGTVAYTAAKHGLVGLTKQLAAAAAPHGINVNLLCPGWTNTSLVDWDNIAKRRGVSVEQAQAQAFADSAQHRILEAEELSGMATLLAGADGRGITGQVISVDGGYRI
jgi:NAD(P)-dependent dehydrogenase (short-subunit alcohol dehydrogenase family)